MARRPRLALAGVKGAAILAAKGSCRSEYSSLGAKLPDALILWNQRSISLNQTILLSLIWL
jgi:hypothetical protein